VKRKSIAQEQLLLYRTIFVLVATLWIFSADLAILNTLETTSTSLAQQNSLTGNFNRLAGSQLPDPDVRDLLIFNGLLIICFTVGYAFWEQRKRRPMKRGQAAMEFMMTYGWAILVAIITIGALSYFGVINSKFAPDTCIISTPGIACKQSLVKFVGNDPLDSSDYNGVYLTLINSFGKDMENVAVTVLVNSVACNTYANDQGAPAPTTMTNGDLQNFYANCDEVPTPVAVKGKFAATLRVAYSLKGQLLTHIVEGIITAKVER